MSNIVTKTGDFVMRVIMIFTTIVALVFFASYYEGQSFIFAALVLLFIASIIIKGLGDIFDKNT